MSDKVKKPFKETGFGKFLNKAGQHIGTVIEVGAEIASGDIAGALDIVKGKIQESSISEVEKAKLLHEMELSRMTWAKEIFALEIEDRQGARQREIAVGRDYFQWFVGAIGLAAFIYILVFITHRQVPDSNRDMVNILFGMISGIVASIYGYYFGSSLGSKNKDLRNN